MTFNRNYSARPVKGVTINSTSYTFMDSEGVQDKSGFLQLHDLLLSTNSLILFFMFVNFIYNLFYIISHFSLSQ